MEKLITIHIALKYTNLKWLSICQSAFYTLACINMYAPFNLNMFKSFIYNLKLRQYYSIIKLEIFSHLLDKLW